MWCVSTFGHHQLAVLRKCLHSVIEDCHVILLLIAGCFHKTVSRSPNDSCSIHYRFSGASAFMHPLIKILLLRNPISSARPTFQGAVTYLQMSQDQLLKWSVKEKAVQLSACHLGADLDVAERLHEDLRETYKKK